MLHQASRIYENHHLDILDHLDNHQNDDHVQSSHYYKNISSTSSPEPPIQQFRVIKDGRQLFEDGYRVSSSEPMIGHDQMGPPPTPTKTLKIISNEEPTSSIPDLGE